MIKVIGVRFRTAGKVYFFDPVDYDIKRGDHVIVETARGVEFGTVVGDPKEVEDDKVVQPLKPVLRIATQKDVEQEAANKEKEKEAFKICLEKIGHSLVDKAVGYGLFGLVFVRGHSREAVYDQAQTVGDVAKGYLTLVFVVLALSLYILVQRVYERHLDRLVGRAAVLKKA